MTNDGVSLHTDWLSPRATVPSPLQVYFFRWIRAWLIQLSTSPPEMTIVVTRSKRHAVLRCMMYLWKKNPFFPFWISFNIPSIKWNSDSENNYSLFFTPYWQLTLAIKFWWFPESHAQPWSTYFLITVSVKTARLLWLTSFPWKSRHFADFPAIFYITGTFC